MRPTGQLHLGNYHGALKNWIDLQYQYECYFFVADWHALTTGYEDTKQLPKFVQEMLIDWLAAGLNPGVATLFVQSQVPEHAELHLLLSMITPLGWLERVPSYKDQQAELKEKDLATYGFLGYPLLQSADILLYKPAFVPVGEDQVAHVEITREVARRFNHLYGREPDFEAKAEKAIKGLGGRNSTMYKQLRKKFQENGDQLALEKAREVVTGNTRLTVADRGEPDDDHQGDHEDVRRRRIDGEPEDTDQAENEEGAGEDPPCASRATLGCLGRSWRRTVGLAHVRYRGWRTRGGASIA